MMTKTYILLTAIGLVLLTSCDHRMSKIDRINHAVKAFNKNYTLTNLKTYYPKVYTEIKTDSIISNTFEVSVKNYSLLSDDNTPIALLEYLPTSSEFHRVFVSDITVNIKGKPIYSTHISAEKFKDPQAPEFWKNATLEHAWVNQEQSNADELHVQFSIVNPISKAFKLYKIRIDTYGNDQLTLLKDYS